MTQLRISGADLGFSKTGTELDTGMDDKKYV